MFGVAKSFVPVLIYSLFPANETAGDSASQNSKLSVCLQLAVAFVLLEAALWTRPGVLDGIWIVAASGFVVACAVVGKFTAHEMGLRRPSMRETLLIVLAGGALAAAIPLLSSLAGTDLPPTYALPLNIAWKYTLWAFFQQFLLQSFFFLRLESLIGSGWAVIGTAVLFASTHIPNPVLSLLCLFGGLFFCEMFRRFRSLLPLGVVHAVLGLTIAASFSDVLLHHMRVGIGYLILHV